MNTQSSQNLVIPTIDQAMPRHIETATFGLG